MGDICTKIRDPVIDMKETLKEEAQPENKTLQRAWISDFGRERGVKRKHKV